MGVLGRSSPHSHTKHQADVTVICDTYHLIDDALHTGWVLYSYDDEFMHIDIRKTKYLMLQR
jgi:hypothetical protein